MTRLFEAGFVIFDDIDGRIAAKVFKSLNSLVAYRGEITLNAPSEAECPSVKGIRQRKDGSLSGELGSNFDPSAISDSAITTVMIPTITSMLFSSVLFTR